MLSIDVYYEYGEETWSTPHSIIEELRSRGHYVTRRRLVDGMDITTGCDLCIIMDWKGLNPKSFAKGVDVSNRPMIIKEVGDCPQNLQRHIDGLNRMDFEYDLLLCPDYPSTLKLNHYGHNAIWWTHFADTRIHHPNSIQIATDLGHPVRSTRGIGGSQFLDQLSSVMPDKFWNRNGMTGREYGTFLACSKITVQNSRWKEITRRIFEGMACGSMVLTDRLPDDTKIHYMFSENNQIVYYDNMTDCISKINYYLYNWKERDRITDNGYRKVMRHHTQVQRVDTILDEYYKWSNK